jgi:hypothetical protein
MFPKSLNCRDIAFTKPRDDVNPGEFSYYMISMYNGTFYFESEVSDLFSDARIL